MCPRLSEPMDRPHLQVRCVQKLAKDTGHLQAQYSCQRRHVLRQYALCRLPRHLRPGPPRLHPLPLRPTSAPAPCSSPPSALRHTARSTSTWPSHTCPGRHPSCQRTQPTSTASFCLPFAPAHLSINPAKPSLLPPTALYCFEKPVPASPRGTRTIMPGPWTPWIGAPARRRTPSWPWPDAGSAGRAVGDGRQIAHQHNLEQRLLCPAGFRARLTE